MVKLLTIVFLFFICACGNPLNDRAVSLDELDDIQSKDERNTPLVPARDALNAVDLLKLGECKTLVCVQSIMKRFARDFVHARKGEFASLHRSVVIDTAGRELVMPLSTLYIDTNPQATWRMAHTLHRPEQADALLEEFRRLGFQPVDSGLYRGVRMKQVLYRSSQYPSHSLYISSSFTPWQLKGLYQTVTWPCFTFEVYTGSPKAF